MRTPMNRPLLALLLLAPFAVAQGVDTTRSHARPLALPKEEAAFQFVVYGDRTGGAPEGVDVLRQAVKETNLLDPDLVMTVGDLVNGYNTTEQWLEQMKEYRAVMGALRMPWYPVAGNHDIYWRGKETPAGHHEANYEKHFGPLWYSFRHKNAAFVVLYSDEGDPKTNRKGWKDGSVNRMSAAQLAWLRRTLESTRGADHVFVFLHHPRWIDEIYPGGNWDEVHALLKAAGNVRAVMAGHIHRRRYDGARDGIEYMTLAVVGGHMPYEAKGTGWLNHFNVVTVRAGRVSYASVAVGATLDPKAMTPDHWKDVDLLRALAGEHRGVVEVAPERGTQGDYAVRYENPTRRPIELVLEPTARGWWFSPDHIHATLAPGAAREFTFRYARVPHGAIREPAFDLDVQYLGPTQRVSLPVRRVRVPARLVDLDERFWRSAPNHALLLDQPRSAVRVASAMAALPDGPFTVEGWVRVNRITGRCGLLAKSQQSEYGLFLYDGVPAFEVHLDGRYRRARSGLGKLRRGEWVHLAGVFDGREVRLYVNGRLAGRQAGSGKRTPNDLPLCVGADPDGAGRPTSSLDGCIDEVRLSKCARYTEDRFPPARRFDPDADTVLLLHFDRAVGVFHPDHSPRRVHALPAGSVRLVDVE
jgi:hypothetical protein